MSFLYVILVGNNDVPTVYCNQGFANGFNVNRNFFQNDFRWKQSVGFFSLNDLLFNSLTIGNDSGYNNSEAVFSGLY